MKKENFKDYIEKKDYFKFKEIYAILISLLFLPYYMVALFVGVRIMFMGKKGDKLAEKIFYHSNIFAILLMIIAFIDLKIAWDRINYIYLMTIKGETLYFLPKIYKGMLVFGRNFMFPAAFQLIGAFALISIATSMLIHSISMPNNTKFTFPGASFFVRGLFGEKLPFLRLIKGEVYKVSSDFRFISLILALVFQFILISTLWSMLGKVGEYYYTYVNISWTRPLEHIFTLCFFKFKKVAFISVLIPTWIYANYNN